MDLDRHTVQLGEHILAILAQHRVQAHLLERTVGPRVLTLVYRVIGGPTGLAAAQRLGPTLEDYLDTEPVDVYEARGRLHICLPSPRPGILRGHHIAGRGLDVPVGITRRNDIVGVDFDPDGDEASVLIAAPPGKGKTTLGRTILLRLALQNRPDQVRFMVVAYFADQWPIQQLPHAWPLVSHADAPAALAWLADEVKERGHTGQRKPHLFAFLDDARALFQAHPSLGDTVGVIATQGRQAGVHLIIMTHSVSEDGVGSPIVAKAIPRRFSFQAASAQEAAQLAGRGGTRGHELLGPGEAISSGDGPAQAVTIAQTRPTDLARAAARLRQQHGYGNAPVPWTDGRTDEPAAPIPPDQADNVLAFRPTVRPSAPGLVELARQLQIDLADDDLAALADLDAGTPLTTVARLQVGSREASGRPYRRRLDQLTALVSRLRQTSAARA